jgi:ribonuclease D
MNPQTMPAPVWVDRPDRLDAMARCLQQVDQLAVDTESNSLFAYREQVCLIQFSTRETDYVLDPLALPNLSVLAPIFSDPKVEKIFHASEYDLICLKRDFHFEVNNIFDTMLAARVLGRPAVGLGSILKEEFNLEVDKRYQRADWGKRPLSQALLSYARLDTRYLIPLRQRLKDNLITAGRWELAQEDFVRMSLVEAPPPSEAPNGQCWRVHGSQDLSAQQMAVLQELCAYRDRQAQRADQPPFKILGNQSLIAIAAATPTTREELAQLRALSLRQLERMGVDLLAAVQRGLNARPVHRPASQRPSEDYLDRLEALRDWRKEEGRKLGVESDVVLPREMMEAVAAANPRTYEDLQGVMYTLPQRYHLFGGQIYRIIRSQEEEG